MTENASDQIQTQNGKQILTQFKNIAIVGISDNPERPSYRVAKYLIEHGYEVIGVNPGKNEILGRPCYPNLKSIPHPIEVVDVFRAVEFLPGIIDDAIQIQAKAIWLQEGLTSPPAEEKARAQGILVVSDFCMKKLHEAHLSQGS